MDVKPPNSTANLIAEASEQWLNACLQPWSMLGSVNAYWSDQWKRWLSTIASAPNPWLPALAEERERQPAVIDFFLPWLPRLDVPMTPSAPAGEKDAVRVMLRAALPRIGTPGPSDTGRSSISSGESQPGPTGKDSSVPSAKPKKAPVARKVSRPTTAVQVGAPAGEGGKAVATPKAKTASSGSLAVAKVAPKRGAKSPAPVTPPDKRGE